MITLRDLGWNDAFEAAFGPMRSAGLEPARVIEDNRSRFTVSTGTTSTPAVLTGRFRHDHRDQADHPKVGDWAAIDCGRGDGPALIHAVLPRMNRFSRKVAGRETEEQVLACNIDLAFTVLALDATFNPRLLERFLVMVRQSGIRPAVLLNKLDLCPGSADRQREAAVVAADAPVLPISALTGEGLPRVRELIRPGATVVFIGASGVGKSSLINRLLGEAVQATTEVRECDAKGRHTTSWRELILLPGGGLVLDTPGIREFHLWLSDEGLADAFADIEQIALGCHFRNCSHTTEARCAVLSALHTGKLPAARYRNYLKLRSELEALGRARRDRLASQRRRARSARPRPLSAPWDVERLDG